MMKKKGDFTNNALSVLVAFICLLLLGYGIFKLYWAVSNTERKNAQRTLDLIEAKINALGDGEENKFLIQGFSGADKWYLVGWSKNEPNGPAKCLYESCICICREPSADVCNGEQGFCREIRGDYVFVNPYFITRDVNKKINPLMIRNRNIRLKNNLIEILIRKDTSTDNKLVVLLFPESYAVAEDNANLNIANEPDPFFSR